MPVAPSWGLIPFDPDMPAYLFVPERMEEQQVPVPEQTVALAEPVSVTGRHERPVPCRRCDRRGAHEGG